jgi:hypothetical protein
MKAYPLIGGIFDKTLVHLTDRDRGEEYRCVWPVKRPGPQDVDYQQARYLLTRYDRDGAVEWFYRHEELPEFDARRIYNRRAGLVSQVQYFGDFRLPLAEVLDIFAGLPGLDEWCSAHGMWHDVNLQTEVVLFLLL